MRYEKIIILCIIIILILSACTQETIKINESILEPKEMKDIEEELILLELKDLDFQKNEDWLMSLSLEEVTKQPRDRNVIKFEEKVALEESILERMKQKGLEIDGMELSINENEFLIFWNKNKGKLYLYDGMEEKLQFLLDIQNFEEGSGVGNIFLRSATNKNSLLLATGDNLYQFDHQGRQFLYLNVSDGFKIIELGEQFAVLNKADKIYIYSYDKNKITHIFHERFVDIYQGYLVIEEGSEINFIDIINGKGYYHCEENIGEMNSLIIHGRDRLHIIDKEDINGIPRYYKINLPKL